MELTELKDKISKAFTGSQEELTEILDIVERDEAVFPFNEYEHLICQLIEIKGLKYEDYIAIRTDYINNNHNLWYFEVSGPRDFGEKFAQTYVQGKCSKLEKPSKTLDPNYSNQYDLWLNGIKIEMKASRAVDAESKEPLYMKALSWDTKHRFHMNFQQLKPQCCDVFIWMAVFRDKIVLWILNSKEVSNNQFYSKGQHRGNKGNEGQLHVTDENISMFSKYQLKNDNLEKAIKAAFKRLKK